MLFIASGGKHDTRRTLAIKIVKMEILITCIVGGLGDFSMFDQAVPIAHYIYKAKS